MTQSHNLEIDLRQMVIAIETAVSLVGMNDTNHGKRVGYIAGQLGHELGFSPLYMQFAFELGMLHDCGVSTQQMHSNLVNHFDWNEAYIHCSIGYQLLKKFTPLEKYAIPLLYHHTPWQELVAKKISTFDKNMANLIFLADRIDVLAAAHYETDILLARQEIWQSINKSSDTFFNPDFVQAFCVVKDCEAFWIALQDRHITRYTWDMGGLGCKQMITLPQLRQLSLIMAYIIDQKSPFTASHSVRVADVAKFIASSLGLNQDQCQKIEIAGLLHDIGKLNIPDHILEKPGPLDPSERAIMNQHSYETFEILRHIKGLQQIADWAAYHHEGLNRSGYPFHPHEQELTIEARIIAVADVFQALVQNRPYRPGMPVTQIITILNEMAEAKKLDSNIVRLVADLAEQCYQIAKGEDQINNSTPIQITVQESYDTICI